jgi:hypothetical protein
MLADLAVEAEMVTLEDWSYYPEEYLHNAYSSIYTMGIQEHAYTTRH